MPITDLQIHSMQLFDSPNAYLSAPKIFYAHFKEVPSQKCIQHLNMKRFNAWVELGELSVVKKYERTIFSNKNNSAGRTPFAIYVLSSGIILDAERNAVTILHNAEMESEALLIAGQLKRFINVCKKTHEISLVNTGRFGLDTTDLKLKKPKLDLEMHYNDDLFEVHHRLLHTLRQKNKSGIILLHGEPGTGKSTYIRYLIHCLNKKVLFIPPSLAADFNTPALISLLLENANSVFVIEDAEDLLLSRERNKNSSISMLLNLTDGLLGESLGIQVICTFNTQVCNIDKALLRKGRLIALYEFKPLSADKSNVLLEEVNPFMTPTTNPMTLSDIFNTEQQAVVYDQNDRQRIGFTSRTQ